MSKMREFSKEVVEKDACIATQPSRLTPNGSKKMTKEQKEEVAKELKIKRDKDRTMVRGIFRNNECPGGNVGFMFRKYAEDPMEKYAMQDGEVYTVPLGVAKHLNTGCWYPVHSYKSKDSSLMVQEKMRRYSFQGLDFMDESLSA